MKGKAGVESSGPGPGHRMLVSADQSVLADCPTERLRLLMGDTVTPLTGAGEATGEPDMAPVPHSPTNLPGRCPTARSGSNLEQARTGAPAQHCGPAPGFCDPHSPGKCLPTQPAAFHAPFPAPQKSSSSPSVKTQSRKWGPSLPDAGGPGSPRVSTKFSELQECTGHKLHGTCVIYPRGSCHHRCLGTEGRYREGAQREVTGNP